MGFIGIDRGIEEHWIYQDAEYFKVWFEILLRARYSNEPETTIHEGVLVTIEYAQFIYGRVSWSKRLKIGEQRLRTLFKKLQDEKMISFSKTFHKFTVYTVNNYAKYNQQGNHQQDHTGQVIGDDANHQTNQLLTSSQPAANQQLTTQEQGNKDNKVKKEKINKVHYAEFVSMTEEEYGKLIQTHGEEFTQQCIQVLNNYKGAKGTKYKSDYMATLNWVVKRVMEDRNKVRPFPVKQQGASNKPQIPVATPTADCPVSPERLEEIRRKAQKLDAVFNGGVSHVP